MLIFAILFSRDCSQRKYLDLPSIEIPFKGTREPVVMAAFKNLVHRQAEIQIWKIVDLLLGLGVLVTALIRLGEKISSWQAAAFLAMLLCVTIIIYSFWLILATLSFWFVRVENILLIFQSIYEAGHCPISLYPGWLRVALTFTGPVAFATTLPPAVLTSHLSGSTLSVAVILAIILFIVTGTFWRLGLRHYPGASA